MKRIKLIGLESWSESFPLLKDVSTKDTIIITPDSLNNHLLPDSIKRKKQLSLEKYVESFCVKNWNRYLLTDNSIQSIITALFKKQDKKYFNIVSFRAGYARAVTRFLTDFRNRTIEPALNFFKNTVTGKHELSDKQRDIINIHSGYEKYLEKNGLFDRRRAVFEISVKEDIICEDNIILFWGFSSLNPLEQKFIRRCIDIALYSIFFYCSSDRASPRSFRINENVISFKDNLKKNFAHIVKLEDINTSKIVQVSGLPATDSETSTIALTSETAKTSKTSLTSKYSESTMTSLPALGNYVCNMIFHDNTASLKPPFEKVYLNIVNNRREEVINAAHWICNRLNDTGNWDDFTVFLPNYDLYSSYINEIFPEYGIPVNWTSGLPFKLFPLTFLIRSFLNQAISPTPFQFRKYIYLSSYVSFSANINKQDALLFIKDHLGLLDEFLLKRCKKLFDELCEKSFFKDTTTNSLNYKRILKREETLYYMGLMLSDKSRYDSVFRYILTLEDKNEREKEFIVCIKDYITLIKAETFLSNCFKSRMTPHDFVKNIEEFILQFQIKENLKPAPEYIIKRDYDILNAFGLLYEKFFQSWSGLGDVKIDRFSITNLVSGFLELLDSETFLPVHKPVRGVKICSHQYIPYKKNPYIMLLGMVEGEFPAREENNFLTQIAKGKNIFSEYTQTDYERQRLYQITSCTEKEIYCSYSLSDAGKGLQCSSFFYELKKIPEIIVISGFTFQKANSDAIPAANSKPDSETILEENSKIKLKAEALSLKEKLIEIGKTIDSDIHTEKEKSLDLLKDLFTTDRGHYIEQIKLSLECRGFRSKLSYLTPFDGLICNEIARKLIQEKLKFSVEFSPKILEKYSACPMRFYFDHLLKVKQYQQEDYHPDNTDRGKYIHVILDYYTKERIKQDNNDSFLKTSLFNRINETYPEFFSSRQSIFERNLKQQFISGLENDNKDRPGLFSRFIQFENENPDLFYPVHCSINGRLNTESFSVNIFIPRIDRLNYKISYNKKEKQENDEKLNKKIVLIYNYTSGEIESAAKIEKGLSFTLPLQVIYLKQFMPELDVYGGGYFQVKSASKIRKGGYFAINSIRASRRNVVDISKPLFSGQTGFGFTDKSTFSGICEKVLKHIQIIKESMEKGFYNLPLCQEQDQICINCSYKKICRKEQARLNYLTELDPVNAYKPLSIWSIVNE